MKDRLSKRLHPEDARLGVQVIRRTKPTMHDILDVYYNGTRVGVILEREGGFEPVGTGLIRNRLFLSLEVAAKEVLDAHRHNEWRFGSDTHPRDRSDDYSDTDHV